MTIPILIYCQEIAIHALAILIVALLSKWIFNRSSLFDLRACQDVEEEVMDEYPGSNNYSQTRYRIFTQ